ncbi:MAG: hypothetical protein ACR2NA_14330 [Solirubrobacterales bacterium]
MRLVLTSHPLIAVWALAVVLVACAPPAPAWASRDQLSVMMDDDRLLYSTDVDRTSALDEMRALGVDAVRLTVKWEVLAPVRHPRGFDGRDPDDYHQQILDRYDRAVRGAIARGMVPYLNVTWPGPSWGHRRASSARLRALGTYRPDRGEFGRFVEMLGRRYSGSWPDANEGGAVLPRVDVWSIGNEPNQGGWLTPQWRRSRGRTVPASPQLYRALYTTSHASLRRTGHGGDLVMLGELAPLGRDRRNSTAPIRPIEFLREVFCLDSRYRPYRGADARARGCSTRTMARIATSGLAYHPYTREHGPSWTPRNREEATTGSISRLTRALDRIASRTGKLDRGLPVMLTEFGYETSPPDPHVGVSLGRQAAWINQATYIAWRNPRVRTVAQFLLTDSPPRRSERAGSRAFWATYQSGLLDSRGRRKPAWAAYALPAHVTRTARGIRIWAQLRFRPNGVPVRAEVQFRRRDSRSWRTVMELRSNSDKGFVAASTKSPGVGSIRVVWRNPEGTVRVSSRAVAVPTSQ